MKNEALKIKRKMYEALIRKDTEFPTRWIDVDDLIKEFSKEIKRDEICILIDELVNDGYAKRDGYKIAAVIGDERPDVKAWIEQGRKDDNRH